MKILDNPNPLPCTLHECAKCHCKFEYTDLDVKKHTYFDANGRFGSTHYYSYLESVDCPNCGEIYIIKSESGYISSCLEPQINDEEIMRQFKTLSGQ